VIWSTAASKRSWRNGGREMTNDEARMTNETRNRMLNERETQSSSVPLWEAATGEWTNVKWSASHVL
jgi:hypothetical protein